LQPSKTISGFILQHLEFRHLKKELSPYKGAKGSVQFPMDKTVPVDLVRKIVIFQIKENLKKNK
jgi:uncharacterized protein YdhG (YjbR/CyaY superfamily)